MKKVKKMQRLKFQLTIESPAFLVGIAGLVLAIMTGTGKMAEYISFQSVDNEMAFAFVTMLMMFTGFYAGVRVRRIKRFERYGSDVDVVRDGKKG